MAELTKYAEQLRQYVANNHKGRSDNERLAKAEAFLDNECPDWRTRKGSSAKNVKAIKPSARDLEECDEC